MEPNNTPITPTPTEPGDGHRPLLRRKVGLVAIGLAAALPAVGLAVNSSAGADEAPETVELVEGECPPLPPEEVAQLNAEQDALAAFLEERGIPYTRETDLLGVNSVGPEHDADGAELELFDRTSEEFYAIHSPPDPETLAQWNAEEDALAEHFDERGIPYIRETDAYGVNEVIWDSEDEGAQEAWDEFQAEWYPMSPEALAEANAEQDELAAFFDERGIDHARETDAYGVDIVTWDENDEAANQAYVEFLGDSDGSCVVVSG